MQGFNSAILGIFHFWQNGTFEPLHEISKKNLATRIFFAKRILLKRYKSVINKKQDRRYSDPKACNG